MLLSTLLLNLFTISLSNILINNSETQLLPIAAHTDNMTTNIDDVNISQSLQKLNASIQKIESKLTETPNISSLQDQLKTLERKINALQTTIDEQDNFGNKLTALEFTLNHVLSKVVYMANNFQPITAEPAQSTASYANAHAHVEKAHPEILSRLGQLLRHVQNIQRDNCRRSTIPAAAGPILAQRPERLIRAPFLSGQDNNQNLYYVEELLRKLDLRLQTLSKLTSFVAELKQLPALVKQNGAQLTRILEFVSQWNSEETQQQQQHGLQHMLDYCQRASDEFSIFAGSSDALLKRIESVVQDTKLRIERITLDEDDKQKKVPQCRIEETIKLSNGTEDTKKSENFDGAQKAVKDEEHHKVIQAVNKSGCHELAPKTDNDGIYAFGANDFNEIGRDFNRRYCTFATDGKAWTIIQRRGPYEKQENFNRTWSDYRNGFGDLSKDFWFGNEFIHRLTYFNNYELLVELESFDGDQMSISYGTFGLDSEGVNYNLFVGDYKGPGPDSFSYHNFMDFSTFDRRNDKSIDDCCPCAIGYGSGWWFDNCLEANLNGIYQAIPKDHKYVGIIWQHWLGDYSLKAARMLIRPRSYKNNTFGDP